jgi:hypothetical protein
MSLNIESKSVATKMSNLELAQLLAEKTTISSSDWHKLKNDRKAQALQQLASSLVYLLNDQPEEALLRINQAQGWLNRSIKPLPCPTHGPQKSH